MRTIMKCLYGAINGRNNGTIKYETIIVSRYNGNFHVHKYDSLPPTVVVQAPFT